MTRQLAVNWEQIQNAIHQWACSVTDITWVWANQDTAQQDYPFGAISMVSGLLKTGLDEIRWDPDEERNLHTGPREFTLGFQVSVGEPNSNQRPDESAESILATLQSSIGFEATREILFAANVALIEELAIVPLDLFIGSDHISRAQLDLRFGTQATLAEAIDPIETLEVTSEYSTPTYGGTDEIDLTGGSP
jgi:hypothetical protein